MTLVACVRTKDPAAQHLGRKGGKVTGGKNLKAWRDSLTPAQISEAARKAAKARWAKRKKGKR